ncbi:MAG: hypothetical protein Q8M65_01020, partial [Rhodoglobus sp.]|nr:hypothetical protein [Rhodoglobus sp.]
SLKVDALGAAGDSRRRASLEARSHRATLARTTCTVACAAGKRVALEIDAAVAARSLTGGAHHPAGTVDAGRGAGARTPARSAVERVAARIDAAAVAGLLPGGAPRLGAAVRLAGVGRRQVVRRRVRATAHPRRGPYGHRQDLHALHAIVLPTVMADPEGGSATRGQSRPVGLKTPIGTRI